LRLLLRMSLCTTLLVTAVVLTTSASANASASESPFTVAGHVYVNDNTAGTNTIAGFNRHFDGSLTRVPGSPFVAGGAGPGAPIASQGSLQATRSGRYLLAVDAASNEISVLRIRPDGELGLVPGGVVGSGGVEPVSIAIHGRLVYVANAGTGGSDFTGFRLSWDGHLRPIPGSTVPLPSGSQPGDVLFNGDGTRLAGTLVGTSQIASFTVGGDGRLTAAPGSQSTAQGLGPFGSEFSPTNPSQLFVSNAHNVGPNTGTVSAFTVSRQGKLISIGASPFADLQTAPCWVEISHDGRFLFAVNTAVPSISSYLVRRDGSLKLIGSSPFKESAGLAPEDARLSPDGGTLYVVGAGAGVLSAFRVDGGNLSELSSSPTALPVGAKGSGIVVN
jgi:6-phosphogluconolactonase